MRPSRLVALGVLWLAGIALVVPALPPFDGASTSPAAANEVHPPAPPPPPPPVMAELTGPLQALARAAADAWETPATVALAMPNRALTPTVRVPEPAPSEGAPTEGRPTEGAMAITVSARAATAPPPPPGPPPPPQVTASTAVVLDDASLAVLYGKGEHERRGPASLTKLATAALAVQLSDLGVPVESTVDSRQMPGSSLMGILPGETYTLNDLLHGLMLVSGNDAARAIARGLAGSEARFVHWMNEMCRRIGLENTRFTDPHGLGGPGHYSSAFDMALLARYAMQFEPIARVSGTQYWTAHGTRAIPMSNFVNGFLSGYEGAEGLKTGFTREAGPTFVGAASRDGHRLYVVLLNSQDRFGEAAALLDWAFEAHTWPQVPQP